MLKCNVFMKSCYWWLWSYCVYIREWPLFLEGLRWQNSTLTTYSFRKKCIVFETSLILTSFKYYKNIKVLQYIDKEKVRRLNYANKEVILLNRLLAWAKRHEFIKTLGFNFYVTHNTNILTQVYFIETLSNFSTIVYFNELLKDINRWSFQIA